MSSFPKAAVALALLITASWALAQTSGKYPGVGRAATPGEVAKWDIDVRPDFKGLPAGSGSVAEGQKVWEAKCASCHGVFGESNEVFNPLIGGVSADDIRTGHVAKLRDPSYPGRTTLMKLATLSTLWDYINRAMPWTQPKSLTVQEVYSVTAFLLNLSGIVPDDFTLSDRNIADVQKRMPNRNGMTTRHALWPGTEFAGVAKADTHNTVCMKDCAGEPKLASLLPDFALDANGNLAQQNRLVGAQRGVDTSRLDGKAEAAAASIAHKPAPVANARAAAIALTQKHGCTACHSVDQKIVGPSFSDIARKYAGKIDHLAARIRSGGSGVWGSVPMPAQTLDDADAKTLAAWLASGAGQ
jgi:cytochrome c